MWGRCVINFVTLLWQQNEHSHDFSRMYDETWAEKLYRGFKRHYDGPFRFVVFTDQEREFSEPVEQRRLASRVPSYSDCIQAFELNEPSIIVGLDTIITGDITPLVEHCFTSNKIALPRDPFNPKQACNGVTLVPAGQREIWTRHDGENDMGWLRMQPHDYIDDLFPGKVLSYKRHVKFDGLGDARIVYFHGRQKPHEIYNEVPWVREHWV